MVFLCIVSLSQSIVCNFAIGDRQYDLTPLNQPLTPYEVVQKSPMSEAEIFYANVCGPIPQASQPKACSTVPDSGTVIAVSVNLQEGCRSWGHSDTEAKWQLIEGNPKAGVFTSYQSAGSGACEKRVALFEFRCTEKITTANPLDGVTLTKVQAQALTECTTIYTFISHAACPTVVISGETKYKDKDGAGFFASFFAFLLLALAAYCMLGVTYNVFRERKQGLEAIPNIEFWNSLISKMRDVIDSLLSRFQNRGTSFSNKYQGGETDLHTSTSAAAVDPSGYDEI